MVVHSERRSGRSRSRILYWFRTPPGVKVGRSALDEDAIRLIEEHNPDVEFDWTRILKGEEPVRSTRRPMGRQPFAGGSIGAPPGPARPAGVVPAPKSSRVPNAVTVEKAGELPRVPESVGLEQNQGSIAQEAVLRAEETASVGPADAPTAAHARLGSEGVLRLRARHAELLARISERIPDRTAREELKTRAERLNPDTWVTDDEVTRGLEEYEATFASLRSVIGPSRRRRHRRGEGADARAAGPGGQTATDAEGDSDADEEPDAG